MSVFVIKIIACITMVLDHIKYASPIFKNFITEYFGRIAFPLFAFLLTEGYIHTKNLKKYYIRLIIFGIISQIPFIFFRSLLSSNYMNERNIMFTLLLGLMAITIYDREKRKYISIPFVAIIIWLGKALNVDYGWYGVSLVFLLYVLKEKKILLSICYFLLTVLYYYVFIKTSGINIAYVNFKLIYTRIAFCMIPLIIIMFYNGELGRRTKYFYYWFYPVHLIIIYILSRII